MEPRFICDVNQRFTGMPEAGERIALKIADLDRGQKEELR